MGRPKIPDSLKVIRGTDQPVRMSGESDVPVLTAVKAPKFLKGDSKKIFEQVTKQLCACRVLTALDLDQLSLYAITVGRVLEAEKELDKMGKIITVKNPDGTYSPPMLNPWLKIQKEAIAQASAIAQQFGLTPVSRMKIAQMLQPKKEEEDPFSEFE